MKNTLLLIGITLSILLTGCNKCDPSNSEGGLIVKDAIVRVIKGEGGAQFITNASQYSEPIEMSLDGGMTYTPVDFSQYSVFALPTTASCSSGYNRSITADDVNEIVTYSITVTECDFCEGSTTIKNWVLTTAVPANYTYVYEIQKI